MYVVHSNGPQKTTIITNAWFHSLLELKLTLLLHEIILALQIVKLIDAIIHHLIFCVVFFQMVGEENVSNCAFFGLIQHSYGRA